MYTCPVCGYTRLRRPPQDFLICSCCGTEFGYDDARLSHVELRARWIRNGAQWFSQATQPPAGWNAFDQLRDGNLIPPNTAVNATSDESAFPPIQPSNVRIIGSPTELQLA